MAFDQPEVSAKFSDDGPPVTRTAGGRKAAGDASPPRTVLDSHLAPGKPPEFLCRIWRHRPAISGASPMGSNASQSASNNGALANCSTLSRGVSLCTRGQPLLEYHRGQYRKRSNLFPDLEPLLHQMAVARPIFHSEDDFKFALAWHLVSVRPGAAVRLETPFDVPNVRGKLDLRYEDSDERVAVELKYKTRRAEIVVNGEEYQLKGQAAQDLGRYDFCRDVWRVESLVRAGRATRGLAILLTNDPAYRSEAKPGSVGEAFTLHESQILEGVLSWPAGFSSGTTKGREAAIALSGSYTIAWHRYSEFEDSNSAPFHYCAAQTLA